MPKAEVIWTESAQLDLYRLVEPLRESAPKRSHKLMNKLVGAAQRLADFPESGRKPLEINDDLSLREVIVEKLRLFYDYQADINTVQIVAVFDARQDIGVLLAMRFGLFPPTPSHQ